ncbi:MAG: histidine phosphatase family protein [Candidatus Nanoarchaeia archaeon]
MKLKIYLFRHGQTYYNKNKYFTGWKDSKLTPKGYTDAETIAKKLKNKKIDLAFCSHLSRSKETLKTVLKYHPECKKTIIDNRIIERNYGDLQGHSHAVFIKKHGKELYDKYHRAYDFPPPNGESVKMTEKRVEAFMKDLFKLMKKEKINVAISAHGNSMRPIRKYFEKLTIQEMLKLENPWDDYFEYEIEV